MQANHLIYRSFEEKTSVIQCRRKHGLSELIRNMYLPQDACLNDCEGSFWPWFSPFELIPKPTARWFCILIFHMMVEVLSNSQDFFKCHRVESRCKWRNCVNQKDRRLFSTLLLIKFLTVYAKTMMLQHCIWELVSW